MSDDTNGINLSSKYKTRTGRVVTDLRRHPKNDGIILGMVELPGGTIPCSWTNAGSYYTDGKQSHDMDLIKDE